MSDVTEVRETSMAISRVNFTITSHHGWRTLKPSSVGPADAIRNNPCTNDILVDIPLNFMRLSREKKKLFFFEGTRKQFEVLRFVLRQLKTC